ncbi:hypothetical protein M2277_004919 [Paenibacillus sp. LBL]|uniref:hypothetical protein n=1 Tax=Paenibacillus sp. LBL TaxID=2940563 RepID=UPI002475447C|nr:hypothetical protein [Paenibacillus sp. LBL]MDH6674227.1 hypothetical protein [Paenibacillus sp. LBL]
MASVWGSKAVNPSVEIVQGVNDTLIFYVDTVEYTIYLDPNTYVTRKEFFTSALVPHVNEKLLAANCPVTVALGGIVSDDGPIGNAHKNVLIFSHNDTTTSHVIEDFKGNANDTVFGTIQKVEP